MPSTGEQIPSCPPTHSYQSCVSMNDHISDLLWSRCVYWQWSLRPFRITDIIDMLFVPWSLRYRNSKCKNTHLYCIHPLSPPTQRMSSSAHFFFIYLTAEYLRNLWQYLNSLVSKFFVRLILHKLPLLYAVAVKISWHVLIYSTSRNETHLRVFHMKLEQNYMFHFSGLNHLKCRPYFS